MKMNKKGFTLIEMLVVIAIIAVLVSIIVPTVSAATEKAKEAADVANIRSAIATVTTNALTGATPTSMTVAIKQADAGFVSTDITSIGGLTNDQFTTVANTVTGSSITVSADANGNITLS